MIESNSDQGKSKKIFVYPWESITPEIDIKLDKFAIEAFEPTGIFQEYPRLKDVAYALKPSLFASSLYPFAKGKALEFLTIYAAVTILYDDVLEITEGERDIEKALKAYTGELKDIDNEPRSEIRLLAKAGEVISHLSPLSLEIFKVDARMYLENLKMESFYSHELLVGGHLDMETYLKIRMPAGSMYINAIDLEMLEVLPEEWRKHSLVEEIKKFSCRILIYMNDYFSEGNMNVRFILSQDFGIDQNEATELLLYINDLTVKHLVKLCNQLEIESKNNHIVKNWIDCVLNLISGVVKWYLTSERYLENSWCNK